MLYMASFHNHTRYSDGSFQLEELVERVALINRQLAELRDMQIKGLAAVDHDFYPNEATIKYANEYASPFGIELIFGTEICADNDTVHVVGYGIDPTDFSFQRHLIKEQYKRLEAFEATCRKLNDFFRREGKTISLDRDVGPKMLKRDAGGRVIEHGPLRWHYLREAMVERGMARTIREANVLIGPVGPCYHQRETIDSVMAVERILRWKGKPVLAHPHRIPEAFRERVFASLIEAGLIGIEAYAEGYAEPEEGNIYVQLARKHNLLVLAGTDLHSRIEDVGRFLLPYEDFVRLRDYPLALVKAGDMDLW